jgi:hypothetical protein
VSPSNISVKSKKNKWIGISETLKKSANSIRYKPLSRRKLEKVLSSTKAKAGKKSSSKKKMALSAMNISYRSTKLSIKGKTYKESLKSIGSKNSTLGDKLEKIHNRESSISRLNLKKGSSKLKPGVLDYSSTKKSTKLSSHRGKKPSKNTYTKGILSKVNSLSNRQEGLDIKISEGTLGDTPGEEANLDVGQVMRDM